jgi:hypothetical protein
MVRAALVLSAFAVQGVMLWQAQGSFWPGIAQMATCLLSLGLIHLPIALGEPVLAHPPDLDPSDDESVCIRSGSSGELPLAINRQDLPCVDLTDSRLSGANLATLNLAGATLRGADLRDACLMEANLAGADLREADLEGVWLIGADLRGADLCGANLRCARLRCALLEGAVFDEETKWPSNFSVDKYRRRHRSREMVASGALAEPSTELIPAGGSDIE